MEFAGEFSQRGGICDIYPPDLNDPIRFEFFGDELESIRTFNTQTQRSLGKLDEVVVLPATDKRAESVSDGHASGSLIDYLPEHSIVAMVEPGDLKEQSKHFYDRTPNPVGLYAGNELFAYIMQRPTVTISALPRPSVEQTVHLKVESVERFSGNVQRVRDELDAIASRDTVLIACQTDAECHRLTEVLHAGKLAESQRLQLTTGHVRAGFRLVDAVLTPLSPGGEGPGVRGKSFPNQTVPASGVELSPSPPTPLPQRERGVRSGIVVLGSHELFHRDPVAAATKEKSKTASRSVEGRAIDSFLDLNEGDYVVHVAHGIAKFVGMKMLEKGNNTEMLHPDWGETSTNAPQYEENLILEFRGGMLLYVPASRIDLVQKYVGGQHTLPELSKLGGTAWKNKKEKVSEAVRDMAAEMIQIQALRASLQGEGMPPDSDWQDEFEASFPFQETPDQLSAIQEIKHDLEQPRPMDRLLCGDVGYGKTEVAIRAAFKAVDNGKQVAVLVPTTVLAEQHYRTFSQRLAEYPFVVESVSRFKSAAQQKEILKRVKAGEVDIVIGTHRIVSKDVKFHDLGLVIIDEEQRFGVEHKERLKKLRAQVHVLTMTATPIPRTLHSALLGIRAISSLETPPPDRVPVETRIIRWDDELLRHAMLRELNRNGQIYFVHNRVHDIKTIATKVEILIPEAKVTIGHGQMAERELEKAMLTFVQKEADILVATTIIESGLDIPSANTMFIDDADMYGLADLHQLRGRVGRTKTRAYAYLIVDPHKMISPTAQKRLKAIEEFTDLGSGFKIAMRDLEIRGAGNILGGEQSGHIASIGYELYCHLLENAVRQMQNKPPRLPVEVNIDLPWPAFLPREYVPGQKLRIEVYRRLARLRSMSKLQEFQTELRDRYGPMPESVEWLLRTTEIRLLCVRWTISAVHRDGPHLILSYRNPVQAEKVAAQSKKRLKVIDERALYLKLQAGEDEPDAMYNLLKTVLHDGGKQL